MKKLVSLVLALVLCLSMACIASATAFTASVESKSAPTVVKIETTESESAVAVLTGDVPEEMALVPEVFLIVTAVADAETSESIPEDSAQALLEVYEGIQDGSIQVPFEELDPENAENLVVRDLFDISWTDEEQNDFAQLLENEDVSLEITFAMEIEADAKVYVMVYKNDTWSQIEQVTNNGDGTITCVFNHLCPVAVIVEADETMEVVNPAEDKDRMTLWLGILAVSVVALTALVAGKKRKQK